MIGPDLCECYIPVPFRQSFRRPACLSQLLLSMQSLGLQVQPRPRSPYDFTSPSSMLPHSNLQLPALYQHVSPMVSSPRVKLLLHAAACCSALLQILCMSSHTHHAKHLYAEASRRPMLLHTCSYMMAGALLSNIHQLFQHSVHAELALLKLGMLVKAVLEM